MRTKVFILPVVGMALLFAACNSGRYKQPEAEKKADASAIGSDNLSMADSSRLTTVDQAQLMQSPDGDDHTHENAPKKNPWKAPPPPRAANSDWDRKIIKTADLDLNVKNFRVFTGRLHAAVKQSGGYIAQEQEQTSAAELENTVMIRVPVGLFEDLITALPADSDKLVQKKISSEDVSMEMVDTRSRLETKKEVLDATVQTGQPPSFFHKVKNAVGEGWGSFSVLLLDMISVWPLWVVLFAAVAWFRRWQRGVRARTLVAAAREHPAPASGRVL